MKSFKEFVNEHYDEYGIPMDGGLNHDHDGMGPHSHPWDAPFDYDNWPPLEDWEKEWDPDDQDGDGKKNWEDDDYVPPIPWDENNPDHPDYVPPGPVGPFYPNAPLYPSDPPQDPHWIV